MQEWFNTRKSVNVTHNISKMKNKNHMIISVDSDKVLDKIQHPFMIKILNKVDMERMCFNMIKVIHIKLINITLCGEKLGESYPSKIRNKTRMPVLTTLIQNSIGSPSQNN